MPCLSEQVCKQNGGVYIKAAQFATNLTAVPPEYRTTMSSLLDECNSVPFDSIRRVIERELRLPLTAVFSSIDEVPVAAASLAQVTSSAAF